MYLPQSEQGEPEVRQVMDFGVANTVGICRPVSELHFLLNEVKTNEKILIRGMT